MTRQVDYIHNNEMRASGVSELNIFNMLQSKNCRFQLSIFFPLWKLKRGARPVRPPLDPPLNTFKQEQGGERNIQWQYPRPLFPYPASFKYEGNVVQNWKKKSSDSTISVDQLRTDGALLLLPLAFTTGNPSQHSIFTLLHIFYY